MVDLNKSLAEHLLALLQRLPDARRCLVAYSGGLDSTVLLDLAAGLGDRLSQGLGAVHIDHGLNPGSAAWARHCQRRCATLGVPLLSLIHI